MSMLPYWLMFGLLAAGALFYGEPKANRSSLLVVVAALFLIAMIGFRYRVGGDWGQYRDIFEFIGKLPLGKALSVSNSDPAYSLINWIGWQFGLQIWFVNLICGALLMWGIASVSLRQPNPWLVLVIAFPYLIAVVGMGYTRQAAAIGLTLVAITALLDQKLWKVIVAIALATAFHKSAIIMLPIIGLSISKNRFVTTILVIALLYLLYESFVSDRLGGLSRNYLQAELQSRGAAQRIAMNSLPAVLFFLAQRRFGFSDDERRFWRLMCLAAIAAVPALFVIGSSTAIDRVALYFTVVQLVIFGRLPWAFSRGRTGQITLLFFLILFAATTLFVWLNFAINARSWIPYRTYPLF
jgi:hypothetical protein